MPITQIAMELGCTRSPYVKTVVFDLFGTNGGAMPCKMSIDDINSIVSGQTLSADAALLGYSETLDSMGYENQFSPLNRELSTALLGRTKKIAFLPLQLYDDANLLRYSNYPSVKSVWNYIVPRLAEQGYVTLIKPHPGSKHRPSAIEENSLARAALKSYYDLIFWCDSATGNYQNSHLFGLSNIVVTVNSSVGFEALYHDKVVVVMGDAIYKINGVFPTLDQAINGQYSHADYLHSIGLLRKYFLDGYLAPEQWFSEPSLFYQRISSMLGAKGPATKKVLRMRSGKKNSLEGRRSTDRHADPSFALENDADKHFPDPTEIAKRLYDVVSPAQRSHVQWLWWQVCRARAPTSLCRPRFPQLSKWLRSRLKSSGTLFRTSPGSLKA